MNRVSPDIGSGATESSQDGGPSDPRVELFILSTKKTDRYICGPRLLSGMEPESDMFRIAREKLSEDQLSAEMDPEAQQ